MNDRPDLHVINGKGRAPRLKLVPFSEISLGREPPYLVQGLIPRVGLTVIWGAPKSGKSFWTFDLAMHLALGWEYRGRRVQQGAVCYAAFEGQSGIRARCEAFRLRFLAEQADSVPFYLEPLQLDLVHDVKELIASIQHALPNGPPVAIVLDTLNRSLRGSENSDEDMSAYVRAADALREAFDCAVLIVHHSGIEATRPRGHTSLSGAADAQLSVKRDGDGAILVTVEAMKDGKEGEIIASRLDVVEVGQDAAGEPITSCVVVPAAAKAPSQRGNQKPLPPAAVLCLRAFESALDTAGEIPPPMPHVPADTYTVSLRLWRGYAFQKGLAANATSERAKYLAFERAFTKLVNTGRVGTWAEGEHCWLVRRE